MLPSPIFTVGHGDRSLKEFLQLLQQARVDVLIDVRRYPGSRRHPQFSRSNLETALPALGIEYRWEGERLGGRRRSRPDSTHTALRSDSFRAYADHMQTPLFQSALADLLALAEKRTIALMCAERLPWRCHRFFLADPLLLAGARVLHLIGFEAPRPHRPSPYAREVNGCLVYDRTPTNGAS